MNILFCNRDMRVIQGGDTNKIIHYDHLLTERGHTTHYTTDIYSVDFSSYDLIHIFHLGHAFSYKFHLEAKRLGIPTVISPIYFPHQANHPVYRLDMLDYATAVFFLSEGEKEAVHKLHDSKEDVTYKEFIIPNGVNETFFEKPASLYVHPNAPGEDYVICVGRLDERKNQVKLANACREIDIPLLLVGDAMDQTVSKQLELIAGDWNGLWWEPGVQADILKEAVYGAKVLACPSTLEMWPNVVAEGGVCGCNLVVSSGSMSFTDVDGVFVCDPTTDSIAEAVSAAYYTDVNPAVRKHFSKFTWEKTIDKLEAAYEHTLLSAHSV